MSTIPDCIHGESAVFCLDTLRMKHYTVYVEILSSNRSIRREDKVKSIVIYYSLDGNTHAAAERIAKELGCDIERIVLQKDLPKNAFARIIVGGGQVTVNKRPPIKPLEHDPKDYDLIILGTPVWAGKSASPIASFLGSCAVPERIRAAFTSSAGGDNERCIAALKKQLPDLAFSCALGDRRGKFAADNEKNLSAFVYKLRRYIYEKQP